MGGNGRKVNMGGNGRKVNMGGNGRKVNMGGNGRKVNMGGNGRKVNMGGNGRKVNMGGNGRKLAEHCMASGDGRCRMLNVQRPAATVLVIRPDQWFCHILCLILLIPTIAQHTDSNLGMPSDQWFCHILCFAPANSHHCTTRWLKSGHVIWSRILWHALFAPTNSHHCTTRGLKSGHAIWSRLCDAFCLLPLIPTIAQHADSSFSKNCAGAKDKKLKWSHR